MTRHSKKKSKVSNNFFLKNIFLLLALLVAIFGLIFVVRLVKSPKDVENSQAASELLYIGANNEVKTFNSATKVWKSLGVQGNTIWQIKKYNGKLYFGFSDGVVKSYDRSTWQNHGDKGDSITTMEVFFNKLYVGQFQGYLKFYDGTSWRSLAKQESSITSLKTYNNKLYLGFTNGCIKSYDGTWKQIGCPLPSLPIEEMEVYNNKLYIGYGSVDGNVYSYDGVGTLTQGKVASGVRSMKVFNGKLYAGSQDGVLYVFENGNWKNLGDKGRAIQTLTANSVFLYTGDSDGYVRSFNGTVWDYPGDAGPGIYSIELY